MSKMTLERLYLIALEEKSKPRNKKYDTEAFRWLRQGGDLLTVQNRLARFYRASDVADYILNNLDDLYCEEIYEKKPITRGALITMLNRYRRYMAPTFIDWYRNDIDFEHIIPKLDQKYGQTNTL